MRCKVFAFFVLLACAWPAAAQTTPPDQILAGYMRIYGGDRDAGYTHFQSLHARDAQSLASWFGKLFAHESRIDLDDTLGAAFEKDIAAFLERAEQRYSRSQADAEALFYLAQAHFLRGKYRFEHDKGMWGAARDAAKAKGYADQYLKLHPEHGDAYLVLGLYNYYVDIAPNFVKVLRILLFLPSGNRTEGLKQLERAAREGSFYAPLADVALADIYASLEGRLTDAIAIGERLVQRFPANLEMRLELAQMYAHPTVEAYDRAIGHYTAVIDQATGSSMQQLTARYEAVLGLSNLRRSQWRLEDAIALLTPVIDQQVAKPVWVLPNALIRRANYKALLNQPAAADDAKRVVADPKMATFHKGAQAQIAFIQGRQAEEANVYAALIPGNRLVVEHKWDEARAVYDRVGAASPGNWQVRFRLAALEFARANYQEAARGMEPIVASTAKIPNWLKAGAMLNLAWTHDLAGRRAEALKLYKRIVDDYENEGSSGAARVGLISPYRGRVS